MNDKNYLAMAVATAKRKKLAHTTPQEYALPIWMMFIAADILENSAMEIQELLMQDEQFIQSDKMHIKAIINHAGKFVRDVDRTCEYQFACKFASELVFTCPINITNEFAGMIDYGFYVHLIGLDKLLVLH